MRRRPRFSVRVQESMDTARELWAKANINSIKTSLKKSAIIFFEFLMVVFVLTVVVGIIMLIR